MRIQVSTKTKNDKVIEVYMFEMTEAEYQEMDNESVGFCIACGEQAYGCEPDARGYACESCEKNKVYGLAELLLAGRVIII